MLHPYQHFVHEVEKPTRYVGGEYMSVVKDWDSTPVKICLTFPDLYEIGMSHMGMKILYSVLNKHEDILAERAYTPWFDMEEQLRTRSLPIYSLETHSGLRRAGFFPAIRNDLHQCVDHAQPQRHPFAGR
jgi:hypothetical protein